MFLKKYLTVRFLPRSLCHRGLLEFIVTPLSERSTYFCHQDILVPIRHATRMLGLTPGATGVDSYMSGRRRYRVWYCDEKQQTWN